MKVSHNIKEFVENNDKEVRRIISHIAKRVDTFLIEDLTQNFYINLVENSALEKFDHTVCNVPAHFSRYIFKCCQRSVYHYLNKNAKRIENNSYSEVTNQHTGDKIDIFETLCVGLGPSDSSDAVVLEDFTQEYVRNNFDEEKFMDMLELFEKDIDCCPLLREKTKQLYVDYITYSRAGMKSISIAKKVDVKPAYISRVKKALYIRFKEFVEKNDGGFEIAG